MKRVYYHFIPEERKRALKPFLKRGGFLIGLLALCFALFSGLTPSTILSPLIGNSLDPLSEDELKNGREVFGFAPYWTLHKLDNIDYNVLTTLAYFGYTTNGDGTIEKDAGYEKFHSEKATQVFKEAHSHGTRVVLTIKQMDNDTIEEILDNPDVQNKIIKESVNAVISRGIDGINVDYEYSGSPENEYKTKFTSFVDQLSKKMHAAHPQAHVTVSVYASAAKTSQLYELKPLAQSTDGIFMMAYDFATAGSDTVIPTSPLYGHKEGKYWYDVSTAVDDFLAQIPGDKLILGLPWYGYDYPVATPEVKAEKDAGSYSYYWYRGRRYSRFHPRGSAHAQTYQLAQENSTEQEGWDSAGQVGWKAYRDDSGGWRMIFIEDKRSLGLKYDYAKQKGLKGVGVWALGFDAGSSEMWSLLNEKFGQKLVDTRIQRKQIYGI